MELPTILMMRRAVAHRVRWSFEHRTYKAPKDHEEAVEQGIQLLDDVFGESWVHDFPLLDFDIRYPSFCAAGLTFGEVLSEDGGRYLSRNGFSICQDMLGAVADLYDTRSWLVLGWLGFDVYEDESTEVWITYASLQAQWETRVRELRAQREHLVPESAVPVLMERS